MGTMIKFLLIPFIIIILCLIILPKTPEERIIERRIIKFLTQASIAFLVCFIFILIFFKEQLFNTQHNVHPLLNIINENKGTIRNITFNTYHLQTVNLDLLTAALNNNQFITKISIDYLPPEKSIALGNAIAKTQHIKELHIENNAPQIIDFLETIFKNNNNIKRLSLHDTNIMSLNLSKLSAILVHAHLHELALINLNLSGDTSALFLSSLLDSHTIHTLSLRNNLLKDEGVSALINKLANNTSLKKLDLWDTAITDTTAFELASALSKNKSLEELLIGYNKITDAGAIALAKAIMNNNHLKILNLNRNLLTDITLVAFTKALNNNTTIISISTLSNTISSKEQQKQAIDPRITF